MIIFIDSLSAKHFHHLVSKMPKKTFPETQVTSSHCFFCQTNNPKPKESSFNVRNDQEEQQILTFNKLEPEHFWHFCLKYDWNDS